LKDWRAANHVQLVLYSTHYTQMLGVKKKQKQSFK